MNALTPGLLATHWPEAVRSENKNPVLVCCGVGVDSVAMLVGLLQQGIRPDLITFADTGSEKDQTYLYVPILRQWLRDVGFPELVVVRNGCPRSHYDSLHGNCLQNETLPSLAFGPKSCSMRWKYEPQQAWRKKWAPLQETWARGERAIKFIGFDATESHRRHDAKKKATRASGGGGAGYGVMRKDLELYDVRYPLQDWLWDRRHCKRVIAAAGLPVPVKSACFMCPASKRREVVQLVQLAPGQYETAVRMEETYRNGKHWRGAEASTVGLGRKWRWSKVNQQLQLSFED